MEVIWSNFLLKAGLISWIFQSPRVLWDRSQMLTRGERSLDLSGYADTNTAWDAVVWHWCKGVLPTPVQHLSWTPTHCFCRAATQPVSPHLELLHEVIYSPVQENLFLLNFMRFLLTHPWASWGPSEWQPCLPAYWVLPSVWQTVSSANFIFLCIMYVVEFV